MRRHPIHTEVLRAITIHRKQCVKCNNRPKKHSSFICASHKPTPRWAAAAEATTKVEIDHHESDLFALLSIIVGACFVLHHCCCWVLKVILDRRLETGRGNRGKPNLRDSTTEDTMNNEQDWIKKHNKMGGRAVAMFVGCHYFLRQSVRHTTPCVYCRFEWQFIVYTFWKIRVFSPASSNSNHLYFMLSVDPLPLSKLSAAGKDERLKMHWIVKATLRHLLLWLWLIALWMQKIDETICSNKNVFLEGKTD